MSFIYNSTTVVVTSKSDFEIKKQEATTEVTIGRGNNNMVRLVISDDAKAHLVAELIRSEMEGDIKNLQGKTLKIFGIPKKLLGDLGVSL